MTAPGIGDLAVPLAIVLVFLTAAVRRKDLFSVFLNGAKEGLSTTASVLPALVLLMTVIGMARASGLLSLLTDVVTPTAERLGFPAEVLPLALLRPLSGSGALAFFEELLGEVGTESYEGRVAAVLMGGTETTFYTAAVYFGAAEVRRGNGAIPAALTADFAGTVASALAVRLFFQ